jgi:hypothetical protein
LERIRSPGRTEENGRSEEGRLLLIPVTRKVFANVTSYSIPKRSEEALTISWFMNLLNIANGRESGNGNIYQRVIDERVDQGTDKR